MDQTAGAKYIEASNADELRRTLQAIQAYVDAPGTLTVANVVATAAVAATGAAVTSRSRRHRTARRLHASKHRRAPAQRARVRRPPQTGDRLEVQVFSPQDHQNVLATNFDNPTTLRLPAGQYDLLLSYGASSFSQFVGGDVQHWLNGITVSANLTTTQTYDFKLGQVTLSMFEGPGKPVPDGNYLFSFRVYRPNDLTNYLASAIVTNTATLQLPAGTYLVTADYPLTHLIQQDQSGQTFEVKAGQSLDYNIDLKLGHVLVEVDDDLGQPIDPSRLNAGAFTLADPNTPFADSYNTNPADLTLRAGVTYNLVITLDASQHLTLSNQQVRAGEVQTIKVNARDFK